MPRKRAFGKLKPFFVSARFLGEEKPREWVTTGWHRVFAVDQEDAARRFMKGTRFSRREIRVKPGNTNYLPA